MKTTSDRTIFNLVANEWKPWFRKFKWLPGKQQNTWAAWFAFLRVMFGEKLSEADLELYRQCTGRSDTPTGGFRESFLVCGRRSGKSRMLAMIAVYNAVFKDWKPYLSPGERGTVMILAADRKQSRAIFNYAVAFLKALDVEIVRETMDIIELGNNINIEIGTADFRTVRGYTIVSALLDEAAFWSDDGANPDSEILSALRPAMATVPQSMLLVASSPYRKSGILFDGWREHFGKNGGSALCWVAPTKMMNPSVPQSFIDAEIEKDPERAKSEYVIDPLTPFRDDISSFIDSTIVDASIVKGRAVMPPAGETYAAFIDVSGGSKDAHSVAVAFKDRSTGDAVLALAREVRTPSTESVVSEFATLLKSYGCTSASADRYGAQWVVDAFARQGITLHKSPLDRSGLYLNLLPQLNSGRVKLLDSSRIRSQLLALERRTIRGTGRDVVDHPQGGHDDLINAVAGAIEMATRQSNVTPVYAVAAPGPNWSGQEPGDFNEYLQRAEVRENEETALGYLTHEEKDEHRRRKFTLGEDYQQKDTGTWRQAQEYLKRHPEHKVGGSQ